MATRKDAKEHEKTRNIVNIITRKDTKEWETTRKMRKKRRTTRKDYKWQATRYTILLFLKLRYYNFIIKMSIK
jgi:hypothetical protein